LSSSAAWRHGTICICVQVGKLKRERELIKRAYNEEKRKADR